MAHSAHTKGPLTSRRHFTAVTAAGRQGGPRPVPGAQRLRMPEAFAECAYDRAAAAAKDGSRFAFSGAKRQTEVFKKVLRIEFRRIPLSEPKHVVGGGLISG